MVLWTWDAVSAVPDACKVRCARFFPGDDVTLCGGALPCGCVALRSAVRAGELVAGVLAVGTGPVLGSAPRGRRLYALRVPGWGRLVGAAAYGAGNGTFVKARDDKYVTARFIGWSGERPSFALVETFGDVGNPAAYDMHLLARHCAPSAKVHSRSALRRALRHGVTLGDAPCRTTGVTIDPVGARDLDDAISVVRHGADGYVVEVHITDVAWALDRADGWQHLGDACQSVYLASGVVHMLPAAAAQGAFSLVAGERRRVLTARFEVSPATGVRWGGWTAETIEVRANCTYGGVAVAESAYLGRLEAATAVVFQGTSETPPVDTHELVAVWMKLANECAGRELATMRRGVFRVCDASAVRAQPLLVRMGLRARASWRSEYTPWREGLAHAALGVGAYAQCTSPIRRLGDLINQVYLVEGRSDNALQFAHDWATAHGTAVLSVWSVGARRAERCSRVVEAACAAASEGGVLPAMVCEVGKRDARGTRRLSLYVEPLDTLLHVATAMPALPVGAAVVVRVFVRGRGGELPRRIGVQLEVEGLAGRDVFECQATDLVESACEGGFVEEGGDRR